VLEGEYYKNKKYMGMGPSFVLLNKKLFLPGKTRIILRIKKVSCKEQKLPEKIIK
jgi:hypothetical protein